MRTALALAAVLGLLALTACGTQQGTAGDDPGAPSAGPISSAADPPTSAPTEVPSPDGEVVGVGTVMDTGRPELCLGAVAESLPPQCAGIPIDGWSWEDLGSTYEQSGDVRWGSYAVTGTYDGSTLTVTREPISSALYDVAAPEADPLVTRCDEPASGWKVVDPQRAGFEDQDAVLAAAYQLPGYAGAFLDDTRLEQPQGGALIRPDGSRVIVNVLVTKDVEGAERTLRGVWGGALCVSLAERTEQELIGIQDGLADLPGLLSSGALLDQVVADVIWDDGTLQAWADTTYGAGLVRINPALRSAG